MNLLIVNDCGLWGGGAENRIRWLVNGLLDKGVCSQIHVLQNKTTGIGKEYADNRVKLHLCDGGYLSSYRMARYIIKRYNIHLLQTHNMLALLPFPVLAGKMAHIPVVWFPHDYWVLCAHRTFINHNKAKEKSLCTRASFKKCSYCSGVRTSLRLELFQKVINKVDLGIPPSVFIKGFYESYNILKGRWELVFPWLDVDEFTSSGIDQRDESIVFVGPLMDYKGAWVAAEALKYILRSVPAAILKFIGYQQEKENIYRKRIEEIGRRDSTLDRMFFEGLKTRDEIKQEHHKAGVYVCPSAWMELFGQNWAEAMACGCPVVASEIGSIPEMAGGKAILVPPGDPERLAQAVVTVLKDKGYAKKIGEEGQKYALEKFSVDRAVDEVAKIYDTLLSKKRK
jgi:glycosyltransferase involved in cell wall biosynthesis